MKEMKKKFGLWRPSCDFEKSFFTLVETYIFENRPVKGMNRNPSCTRLAAIQISENDETMGINEIFIFFQKYPYEEGDEK